MYFSKEAADTTSEDTTSLGINAKLGMTNDINFYPNPSHDWIKINSEQAVTRLLMYDVHGTLVKSLMPQSTSFDVKVIDLPVGSYLLRIETESTETSARFIRN
jgi:hypothetical protein